MAESPSPITISAAQAPFQSKEVTDAREARRAGQAHAATRQVKTVDETGTTVDTADADARVFTDAEGTGSQGRELDTGTEANASEAAEPSGNGITADKSGQLHLDLEA